MKKYKVELKDKDGLVVLTHNLFATDDTDAQSKCNTLAKSARDKKVCSASFNVC